MLDIVCVGNWGHFLLGDYARLGEPSPETIPIRANMRRGARTSSWGLNRKSDLSELAADEFDRVLELPAYHIHNSNGVETAGSVRSTLERWRASFTFKGPPKPGLALIAWPPVAALLVHKKWNWVACPLWKLTGNKKFSQLSGSNQFIQNVFWPHRWTQGKRPELDDTEDQDQDRRGKRPLAGSTFDPKWLRETSFELRKAQGHPLDPQRLLSIVQVMHADALALELQGTAFGHDGMYKHSHEQMINFHLLASSLRNEDSLRETVEQCYKVILPPALADTMIKHMTAGFLLWPSRRGKV